MNRIGEEQFSPSPPVFTSIFSVSTGDLGEAIVSERCGLGWSFKLIPEVPSHFSFGSLIKTQLILQLEPWTVALSESFPFNRIRCTVTVDCSDPLHCRQPSTMTTTLKSSISVLGQYLWIKQPLNMRALPVSSLTLRFIVELLSNGDAPAEFGRRIADVLTESIRSGHLINTKFYLYSRHCGDRGASHPKPLFASSSILTKLGCEDLEVFLNSGDFKNSEDVAIDLHSASPDDFKIDMYEYDSDSDLEDDEYSKEEMDQAAEDSLEPHLRNEVVQLQERSRVAFLRTGRVIFLKDIAFRTWNAFIKYVYFSEIEFSKLQSTYPDAIQTSVRPIDHQKCSPKSMYRLADKLGIDPLKKIALEAIKSQLTRHNISKEVFSRFTSKYPEVLDAEVGFLIDNCPTGEIESSVSQALAKFGSPEDQYLQYALQKIMAETMAAQGPFVKKAASA